MNNSRKRGVGWLLGTAGQTAAPYSGQWIWVGPSSKPANCRPVWVDPVLWPTGLPELAFPVFLDPPAGAAVPPAEPMQSGCDCLEMSGGQPAVVSETPQTLVQLGLHPEPYGGPAPPTPSKTPTTLQPVPGSGTWIFGDTNVWLGNGQKEPVNKSYSYGWVPYSQLHPGATGPPGNPYVNGFSYAYNNAVQYWPPNGGDGTASWPSAQLPGPPISSTQPKPTPTPTSSTPQGDTWYSYGGHTVWLPAQAATAAPFQAGQPTAAQPANYAQGFEFITGTGAVTSWSSAKPYTWPVGYDFPGGGNTPPTNQSWVPLGPSTPGPAPKPGVPDWVYWAGGAVLLAGAGFGISGALENGRLRAQQS